MSYSQGAVLGISTTSALALTGAPDYMYYIIFGICIVLAVILFIFSKQRDKTLN